MAPNEIRLSSRGGAAAASLPPGRFRPAASISREDSMTLSTRARAMGRIVLSAASVGVLLALAAAPAQADALRDKWCGNVHIRFFVGGAEGDAFGTIVYNGAVQAAHDLGAKVDYEFSGWDQGMMIQQLREAIAAKPDGIAMMGHPGNAAIMPLADEASKAGIKMIYQNVAVDDVVAKFGGSY